MFDLEAQLCVHCGFRLGAVLMNYPEAKIFQEPYPNAEGGYTIPFKCPQCHFKYEIELTAGEMAAARGEAILTPLEDIEPDDEYGDETAIN